MNIAVYVPLQHTGSGFIVGTFFPLFKLFADHRFLIITHPGSDLAVPGDFEFIHIKPPPKNGLLKKLWIERTLANVLKKISADIFISAGNFCSIKASLPQYILMPDPHRLKQVYVQKAQRMIVGSEWEKSKLKAALKIPGSKIEVVYPFVNEKFSPIEPEKREAIKNKYSQGREYFLCTNSFHRPEDLINLLKAFSHFKKRQQSSFQLLLVTAQDASIKEKIANYKYRNDVAFIEPNPIEEAAAITAAAYALVFPIITNEDTSSVLHAMNSAVPVITINHSSINEMAGDAAMYAEDDIKDMGEKMMHLYKDETLRFQLIEKGKERVKNFTIERSASQLWRSVINALN
jgi:glycosyltransferase involved in cell wall biosynthesis